MPGLAPAFCINQLPRNARQFRSAGRIGSHVTEQPKNHYICERPERPTGLSFTPPLSASTLPCAQRQTAGGPSADEYTQPTPRDQPCKCTHCCNNAGTSSACC
jgi:hypothetical protein